MSGSSVSSWTGSFVPQIYQCKTKHVWNFRAFSKSSHNLWQLSHIFCHMRANWLWSWNTLSWNLRCIFQQFNPKSLHVDKRSIPRDTWWRVREKKKQIASNDKNIQVILTWETDLLLFKSGFAFESFLWWTHTNQAVCGYRFLRFAKFDFLCYLSNMKLKETHCRLLKNSTGKKPNPHGTHGIVLLPPNKLLRCEMKF